MRKDAKLELLRQVPLFAGCTKKELSEISTLADELSLPAGTTLIRREARSRVLPARRRRGGRPDEGPQGEDPGNGAWFGEMALVSSLPRNATVTALSPVRVLVVHEQAFRRLLRDSPGIQLKVLQTLADRAVENALAEGALA